jgi:putative membrane protein
VQLVRYVLLSWVANAITLGVVAGLFDKVSFDGWGSLIGAAALFGILNTIVKPVLKLLTLPVAVLTLGIAWFFVAMLMLAITDWLVRGFHVDGFWTFVGATIVIWVVNLILEAFTWAMSRGARLAT